ncbi:MAG: CHAT domain-containing protein [Acidobacteriota bacterium]
MLRILFIVSLSCLLGLGIDAKTRDDACVSEDLESQWDCFVAEARNRDPGQSIRDLESRLEVDPDSWAALSLARLLWNQPDSGPRIEQLLRGAVEDFEGLGDASGCRRARLILARRLGDVGRFAEADETLAGIERCGAGSPHDRVGIATERARLHLREGEDLGLALLLLKRNEPASIVGPLATGYWNVRAILHHELGQTDAMLEATRRLLAIAESDEDRVAEAFRRTNLVIALIAMEFPTEAARARILDEAQLALDAAQSSDQTELEVVLFSIMSRLERGDVSRRYLDACFDRVTELESTEPTARIHCLKAAAQVEGDDARPTVHEAISLAARLGETADLLRLNRESVATLIRAEQPHQALETADRFLDLFEDLRLLQDPRGGRRGLVDAWMELYQVAAGLAADSGDLQTGLVTLERMRSRSLLDSLVAAHSAPKPSSSSPTSVRLRENLQTQIELQRQIISRSESTDVSEFEARLRVMEEEESRLWQQVAREAPAWAAVHAPTIPTVDDLQRAVAENEAIVSFQVADWQNLYGDFDGGSWAFVVDRHGARVHRLPGLAELQPAIDMLDRLPSPDAAPKALARLRESILGAALADLPPEVDHLVLVPDGPLHQLPWAALRLPSPDDAMDGQETDAGVPLSARYSLSVVPSLTLWHRWRRGDDAATARSEVARRVVALADPAAERPTDDEGTRRWLEANSRALEPLPWARREGRSALDAVGRGLLLAGDGASEPALQSSIAKSPPAVLHFAAHAVADLDNPSRSAVVLSAAGDDDGLLRPHEIARLPLDGSLIVLSTCDSAAGQVLRGEGALSLARPFFQAGAPTIVASLRPVRDRATARLFERFYRALARGHSAGDALAGAQASLAAEGAPAADWSSFVLLGDGALVPFPDGAPAHRRTRWLWGAAVLLALALGVVLTIRRTTRVSRRALGPV